MQLTSRYLVKNRINVVANLAGFVVEYKPVYQREIQVYKGIENVLEFRLLNADQKPVNTSNYVPMFLAFDEAKNLVIEKTCEILDDGSSATKGLFIARITESELIDLKQQFLSYTVYLKDQDNKNIITYTDSHFGNDGTIRISSEAFPGPKASKVIDDFVNQESETDEYLSSALDAEPGINGNSALHTAAIYTDQYVGTVTVQVTLDSQINEGTTWSDIETIEFDGNETEPKAVNFFGVFNWVRFKTSTVPTDKITKILVRN